MAGHGGFLINSRGTTVMVDPFGRFDMPVMIEFPIAADDVPNLDAVLVTHSDNDHYSVPTCRDLAGVTREVTQYVASLMKQQGLPAYGHDIGEHFAIGPVGVEVTPADHAWQNESPGASDRVFQPEDCCGFWIDTPDGAIWAPGDSRLIPVSPHPPPMPCCSTSPTASGTSDSTARSRWRTPIHTPCCCCTTGAALMLPISRRSTPTPTRCRTGSRTRNASVFWRPASPSCCTDCRADHPSTRPGPAALTSARRVRPVAPAATPC